MRGVNIADCENLFIKDEYRHIVFTEEDMDAVLRGEYVVTTPTPDTDTRQDPSKRVRWRESLEEMFYEEPDTECVVVDLGQVRARPPPRPGPVCPRRAPPSCGAVGAPSAGQLEARGA